MYQRKHRTALTAFWHHTQGTYANWINKSNSNGAGHVSVMIAGGSNYNMKKHEQYLNRERKLGKNTISLKTLNGRSGLLLPVTRSLNPATKTPLKN